MRKNEIHWREHTFPPGGMVRVWSREEAQYGSFRVVSRSELRAMSADNTLKEVVGEDDLEWEED